MKREKMREEKREKNGEKLAKRFVIGKISAIFNYINH